MNISYSSGSANSGDDQPSNIGVTTFGAWDNTTLSEVLLQPVMVTIKEFQPLSLCPLAPGQGLASVSLADRYTLEKQTPRPPGQEHTIVQRNLDELVSESEKMINSGFQQTKHSTAISTELKLLLKNEKKIMDQILKRCQKFSQLKEENKQKTEEWLEENRKRHTKYDGDLTILANYPDDLNVKLDEEEMQSQIRQNILLEIIHKTAEIANDISVQLSIEDTIINDVDLSLSSLKKHSLVMLRLISGWTEMLSAHDKNQEELLHRWLRIKRSLSDLRARAKARVVQQTATSTHIGLQTIVSQYDDRLRRLERACNELRANHGQ